MKNYANKLIALVETFFSAVEKIEAELADANTKYTGIYLAEKSQELNSQRAALRDKVFADMQSLYEAQLVEIQKPLSTMNGSDINEADLRLLDDKFFPVEQAVFDNLATKYKDNFAMTQALRKYARDHVDEIIYTGMPDLKQQSEIALRAYEAARSAIRYGSNDSLSFALEQRSGVFAEINRVFG